MSERLVIGDVHLSEVYSDYFRCILFPFLRLVHSKRTYDEVILIGDVFNASSINNDTSELFKELLSIYSDIKIIVVNGNHDKVTKTKSIFDILILPDNVTVYKDVHYDGNAIYIPHIDKTIDHHGVFDEITRYIKSNNLKTVFMYSHNDFTEIYKFKNNFFNVTKAFENIKSKLYLVNGHNHVPFFKKNDNLYIFNMGCSLNTSFGDTALYNYFLQVNEDETDVKKAFRLFNNKYSVQYYTFHIWKDDQIYEKCKDIVKENYTFVKFKIHDPSIAVDNNLKTTLQEKYNIVDILVDYELDDIANLSTTTSEDSTSLSELCNKLNITVDEFVEGSNQASSEKMEIMFSLLHIMFESRNTSENDMQGVIDTIKKYLL